MKTSNVLLIGGLAAAALLVFTANASAGGSAGKEYLSGLPAGASGLAIKAEEPSIKSVIVALSKIEKPPGVGAYPMDPLPALTDDQAGRLAALVAGWELAIAHKLLVSGGMTKPTWQALLLDVFTSLGGVIEQNAPSLVEQVLTEAQVDPLLAPKFGKYPYAVKDALSATGLSSLPAAWKSYLAGVLKVP